MIKKKTLIIMLSVLAALCLACVLALGLGKHTEKMKTTKGAVLSFDVEDVTEFSWSSSQSSYSFAKEGGVWTNEDDEAFPVNEDKITELLESICAYEARFIIESPEKLSDYGLNKPTCTITVKTDDDSYELKLGSYSSMDSERYFSIGDGNAYLAVTDVLDSFMLSDSDLIKLDKVPDMSDLKSFKLSGQNNLEIIYQEDAGYCYSDEYTYYLKSGSSYKVLGNDEATGLIENISKLSLVSYEDYADADFASYGLDDPQLTATVTYMDEDDAEQEFTVAMTKSEDDTVYAKVGDSYIIYKLSINLFDELSEANYETLRPSDIVLVDWDEVASVKFTLDDASGEFTPVTDDELKDFEKAYKEAKSAAEDADEDSDGSLQEAFDKLEDPENCEDGWVCGEWLCDADGIKEGLEKISLTDSAKEKRFSHLEIGFTITMNDGDTIDVKIYRYDEESCLAYIDGQAAGLVGRTNILSLAECVYDVLLK